MHAANSTSVDRILIEVSHDFLGRWGGIWAAPITYKFDTSSSSQTKLKLIKKFDNWTLGSDAIANRMPHIVGSRLTTQTGETKWGSITGEIA